MGATWADGRTVPVGLLSPVNAAKYLDTSRSDVYELMKSGDLPYVRLGNRRRIRVADLDNFIARLAASAGIASSTPLEVVR